MRLQIAPDFTFPAEDATTGTFSFVGVRGAGKSNAARVMAEEMFRTHQPFAAVDPVGSWRGLRSSRDGKSPGLPVPIFGGKYGDVPLERGAGELIADLLVEKRVSCVIDLSRFESEADKKYFLLAFAKRLYLKNEEPLHLFLEEADDYIPQQPMRDEAQLLRAWENIVRRGRARGLGITLITQRSAAINKMVLTQTETLIALRSTSPQDRAAIEAWTKYHAQGQEIISTLASLDNGEAWVWSPHFLKSTTRIRFRLCNTFDSGQTPRGEKRKPVTMADIDMGALQERMAATIEKAKAEDPRELRRQIASLKAELAKKPAATAVDTRAIERAQEEGRAVGYAEARKAAAAKEIELKKSLSVAFREITRASGILDVDLVPSRAPHSVPLLSAPQRSITLSPPVRRVPLHTVDAPAARIAVGEKKILTACAQHPRGATREQLTVLTGYKRSSRDTYLQRLQARGLVEIGPSITATAEGVAALGPDFRPLPTGEELREHYLRTLPEGERKIFEALIQAYPATIAREALEEATGYKRSSRDTYIQRLRSRQVLEIVGRGELRASEELFQE